MDRIFNLLKTAVAIVAYLFGAFNNFLDNYAPPPLNHETGDSGTGEMSITIAKFISLILLLFLSLFINYKAIRNLKMKLKLLKVWLWVLGFLVIVFVVISFNYQKQYEDKTFTPFGNDRYIRGTLNPEAISICKAEYPQHDTRLCEIELMNDVGAERMNMYWEPTTREKNRNNLQILYLAMVITLSSILFSIIELLGWKLIPANPAK